MTRAADRLIVGGCKPGNRNNDAASSPGTTWSSKGLPVRGCTRRRSKPPPARSSVFAGRGADSTRPAPALPDGRANRRLPRLAARTAPRRSAAQPRCCALGYRHEEHHGVRTARIRSISAPAPCSAARWCIACCNRCRKSRANAARDAALRYLARNATDWSEAERDALARQVLALLDDARFAPVFAAGSRAEVAIVGRLARPGGPALVSGQIDRLVVTPSEVLIVDYKTGPAPPPAPAEAPPAYIRQLALYRAVLEKLYPRIARPCSAALDGDA